MATKTKLNKSFADLKNQIGEDIKKWRTKRNLKQRELADRSGVSRIVIIKIEGGRTNPSLEVICKLVNALEVKIRVQMTAS